MKNLSDKGKIPNWDPNDPFSYNPHDPNGPSLDLGGFAPNGKNGQNGNNVNSGIKNR